ncbi:MAG: GAF domain-containing protein [Salinivirgaceae bacterium]|nr:GAF domain-containing protein [Salinivirgaceae bacterium]
MIKLLNRMAVRTKLMSSFLLLASFVLILGVTAIIIQEKLEKSQNETLVSKSLSDAFFEGKYFLRSDMHIFTELVKTEKEERLNYWWGEHDFQIQFFTDQIKKVEKTFLIDKSIQNDTLKNTLLSIIQTIENEYENSMLPIFSQIKVLKIKELELHYKLNDSLLSLDQNLKIESRIKLIKDEYIVLNKRITDVGLGIIKSLDKGKDLVQLVINQIEANGNSLMASTYNIFLLFTIFGVLFSFVVALYISKLITRPVKRILKHVYLLGQGEHPEKMNIVVEDEFGKIQNSLNALTNSLVETSVFSEEIGQGNFESNFTPMGDNDILGNSLLQMRNSLKTARFEEEKRKAEDDRRNWAASGIAKFGDIMRQSGNSLEKLGFNLISNLVDYLDAVQGALFVINEENEDDKFYELISAIAFGRDKFMRKEIRVGEGLVGRVAYEEKTIYLKEIPENYVKITSGLGNSNPQTILLVPVKLEHQVNGVIELISFKEFEDYQIEFVEKIGENIASYISTIKINEKTAILLTDSQHKSEELTAQEEEMRQNMEELQATQEEAARREEERNMLWDSLGKMTGMVETDLSGSIINVNTKASLLLGTSPGDLDNQNYKSLFLKNIDGNTEAIWDSILNGIPQTLSSKWNDSTELVQEIVLVCDNYGIGVKVLSLIRNKN